MSRFHSLAGGHFYEWNDYCPFIENGATAINWEGSLSPCIPLQHSHKGYFEGMERISGNMQSGMSMSICLRIYGKILNILIFASASRALIFRPVHTAVAARYWATMKKIAWAILFSFAAAACGHRGGLQCP